MNFIHYTNLLKIIKYKIHLTKWLNYFVLSIIFNHMVEQNNDNLNNIFQALADPTRREIVRLIASNDRTVSELAAPFDMSLAAISKHIKVLERAGLLEKTVEGRTHICRLNPHSLSAATEWLRFYERFWNRQFDVFERELNKAKKEEH
ncbi:metalloregulator ArsR/SmtB family transcription factor [Bacillus sp. CECT 9360]|uniref:ArsR/SmtB family transcription factor n=1 Tax=Bacillus sp. CECT 9360 TaxID=2845821 RepID=UPI001E51898A|nr:metalloregulator ArsR/SmtB family transcription factor [Bacillus sp. CECT 9360]CAH0346690.1 hypothetical protein BCI9360_03035 [Bacillus sp. CECT 9360]